MPFDIEEFFERVRAHHREQVAAGEHDDSCEWRDNGHYICNCSMRARVAAGFTEAPTLIIQYPMCGRCYKEVGHDGDSFVCETCHVSWNHATEDEPGTFTDDMGDIDIKAWDEAHA